MTKVLITGADGFIGSHLTELLLAKNYQVKALSNYNSFNYWGWLEEIPENKNLEIVSGDIRDPHFCQEIMKGIDMVFNLAALIAIPYSYIAPDSYIETNIKGTLNICQAARDNGNIRFFHTSTSEVYGTAQYVPIDEKHPKQPQSPYSASKIGADALAMSFFYAFNLPVTIVRPFNTYGPRQSARAIIPSVITQITSGNKTIKLGDPSPTRDFNFVKDICRGFLAISENDETIGKEINISSNTEVSIGDIIEIIKGKMRSDIQLIYDEERKRPVNSEVYRLCGDNSLIKKLTNWKPEYDLNIGLEETINWYKDPINLRKYKVDRYNL